MRNPPRLNLFDRRRDMRRVLAVVEAGTITRAAGLLNVTQPALTRTIRRFEKSLGAPIFSRHNSGVALTGLGRVVVEEFRRVLRQIEDAEAYVVQTRDNILRQAGEGPAALCAEARDGDGSAAAGRAVLMGRAARNGRTGCAGSPLPPFGPDRPPEGRACSRPTGTPLAQRGGAPLDRNGARARYGKNEH